MRVPRTTHSSKPKEVADGIEKMFPTQDKIELFARHRPNGWDVWGLDVREVYDDEGQLIYTVDIADLSKGSIPSDKFELPTEVNKK